MTLAETVSAGGRTIGPGSPPLFLPDIATFFGQDEDAAVRMIDLVASAGLEYVKGELLHDPDICLPGGLEEVITTRDLEVTRESYREVVERKVLPLDAYERLFAHTRDRGLRLAVSVYDRAGLAFALDQRVELLKIASSNVVHRPLISAAAASGTPVLMDTGGTTEDEVSRAVGWFVDAGGTELVLEHSPPAPPASVGEHGLGRLEALRSDFGCPVGLSDHHAGDEMLYAAVALGASLVEKGVAPDEVERDQDLGHSLRASELAAVARSCENVYEALGAGGGIGRGHPARMGILAARDLEAGRVLEESDLSFAFPALGVPVEETGSVLGRRLLRDLAARTPILPEDLV